MKLESFGECLASWMRFQSLSVAQLTDMLGFKSKTSVFRMLKGESNEQSINNLYQQLSTRLNEEWQDRFRRALRVEKYGFERYQMFLALRESNHGVTAPVIKPEKDWPKNDTILICGYPWDQLFPVLDALLERNNQIIHYVMRDDAFLHPRLLAELITHISALNYQAILIERSYTVPWNIAYTDSGKIYLNGKWLDTGKKGIANSTNLEGIPLYSYEELHRGDEYLDLVKNALKLEKDAATVIMRPTPGLQMMPADIEFKALSDYLAEKTEPISAVVSSLRMIMEKRIRNFFYRRKPTMLLLSKKAMDQFLHEGTLTDHFFAMRPFTMEERIEILRTLGRFSKREDVQIAVMDEGVWNYSFEAYENRGLLVYFSSSTYNSELKTYRELFLPGNKLYALLYDFIQVALDLRETVAIKHYMENAGIV